MIQHSCEALVQSWKIVTPSPRVHVPEKKNANFPASASVRSNCDKLKNACHSFVSRICTEIHEIECLMIQHSREAVAHRWDICASWPIVTCPIRCFWWKKLTQEPVFLAEIESRLLKERKYTCSIYVCVYMYMYAYIHIHLCACCAGHVPTSYINQTVFPAVLYRHGAVQSVFCVPLCMQCWPE
jgi:hypothetical protein